MSRPINEVPLKRKDSKEFKFNTAQLNPPHCTHDGIKLSLAEELFIEKYIETGGDLEQSYLATGKSSKNPLGSAKKMLKSYIKSEIQYRLDLAAAKNVADKNEILSYLTSVMRGDVFGEDSDETPTINERTRAAQELAKHQIEAKEKLDSAANKKVDLTIVLDWERPEIDNIDKACEALQNTETAEDNENIDENEAESID